MTYPLVSIITPTYNRANYLPETISSILEQDYPRIEYIIIDDGSTDHTPDLLKSYKGHLRWFRQENAGEQFAVNKGFDLSTGEIICTINSDDTLLPNAVSTVVKYLMDNPQALVVYPDWLMTDQHSNILKSIRLEEYDYTYMVRKHHCFIGPGAFFRREALKITGGRDTQFRYTADFDFWLTLGLYGHFIHIPKPLATFRIHPQSISTSYRNDAIAKEHIQLMEKYFSRNDIPPHILDIKEEAISYAYLIAAQACGNFHARAQFYYRNFLKRYPYHKGIVLGDIIAGLVGALLGNRLNRIK